MNVRRQSGFALVITLVLLALLVLAVFALSALTKVSSEMARSSVYQTQARQNAQLALDVALGELQRHAGDDTRITGMAGITGIAGNPNASTRYWCGVWRNDGTFVTWLTSGAVNATSAGPDTVELISTNTVGPAASTSANVEKEHVIAGRVPILLTGSLASPGTPVRTGNYAYVVMDEGIKIGAYAPPGQQALPGVVPVIGSSMLTNQLKLRTALDNNTATLPAILTYEQLGLLSAVTPSVLQDCFHYVTLTPRFVSGNQYFSGMININTSSTLVWRSLLDTYNAVPGVTPVASVTSRGNSLGNNFASTTAGKPANGPFTSTVGFATYLATIFPITGSPSFTQIMTAIGSMLTVRSDTFRIRAYGEALNPVPEPGQTVGKVEATAYCEAVVQRTPQTMPGFGRRFVITYFRWLGPDDI
jgi:Tfp pilus assembly protein PilX